MSKLVAPVIAFLIVGMVICGAALFVWRLIFGG